MGTGRLTSTGQSRSGSAIETGLNVGSGVLVSWLAWVLVAGPVWHIPINIQESIEITVFFTLVGAVRSFLWRRFFNRKATP